MNLKHDTWYWVSHPHEGDIFYPVLVVDDKYFMMDGQHFLIKESSGAIFTEAEMPAPCNT